jgi:hypothetical protein
MNALHIVLTAAAFVAGAASVALAAPITVVDAAGKPLATVMVSRQPVKPATIDTSDNGYPASGKPQQAYSKSPASPTAPAASIFRRRSIHGRSGCASRAIRIASSRRPI